jgi:hypothetical protein
MPQRRFLAEEKEWRVFDVVPLDQMLVAPDRRDGWLCFESASELRRLAPIPHEWETATSEKLIGWLETASRVRPSPPGMRRDHFRLEE